MNRMKRFALLFFALALVCTEAFAQSKVKVVLKDAEAGSPVEYATVTLTRNGAKTASYAALTTVDGDATMFNVKNGTYVFKAELMGYKTFSKTVTVEGNLDLGVVSMKQDRQMLSAASISAVGNPIIIKKDTVEYNANAFKTTENDVLEDLLKKLPGVEVGEDGSITVNGETINKITIDGKTFFLDDPQLASKNIPAKVVEKLKVIEKKSEQAQFTGIDDGQEEYVIDLSVKKGMMKGLFGNVMGGGGHDLPSGKNSSSEFQIPNDWRYQGAGFVGHFTDSQQISGLVNVNNTNNRGFNDLSGSMMQGMRGGGGGMGRGQGGWGRSNGITTSYMAGLNGAWDLLDKKMELGGNYLFNGSDKDVKEKSRKTTYLPEGTMTNNNDGNSWTRSLGHRFGLRLDHKFNDNTSILFQPQVNFGNGRFTEDNTYSTLRDGITLNDGKSINSGNNRNVTTSGFLLLRQKLGKPGRTLSLMARYNFSNNDLDSKNFSETSDYSVPGATPKIIDQNIDQNKQSMSFSGRLTYTEPLGKNFFLEANYQYAWNLSTSYKNTFDNITGQKDEMYSNNVYNKAINQTAGINAMFQNEKVRAQLGFAVKPTKTHNETTGRADFDRNTLNYSPQAMLYWEISDFSTLRFFYYGNSNQASVNQLMPVPDNTDPLNIQYGNIRLDPYFSHNLRGNYRYNNKKNFTSVNIHFGGGLVQSPIVSAMWYSPAGVQYTMPFNGPTSANANVNGFFNIPIAKSNFSISNMLRVNWSKSASYVMKKGRSMEKYYDPEWKVFDDEQFLEDYGGHIGDMFETNNLQNLGFTERLRLIYRNDALELTLQGRTRFNQSWYSIATEKDQTATWNNQVRATVNWTWEQTGIGIKSEFNFNWYNGYSTPQPNEYVWDAEISKLLLKKKMTIAVKCYDILGQAKNLNVSDNNNYHQETLNNTLGRYIMCSLTYRFGTMDKSKMRGMGGRYMR